MRSRPAETRDSLALPLLVAVLSLGAAGAPRQPSFESHMAQARQLLDAGELDQALEPLKAAHTIRPGAPEPLWMLAVAHLRLERFEAGLPYAETLAREHPGDIRAGLLLGAFLEALGRDDGAKAQYEALSSLDPENPQVLQRRALLSMRRGDDAAALSLFEELVARYPDDPRALIPLGTVYARNGRSRDALDVLRRALRSEPASADAHRTLGALYSELGHFELAHRHLDRALELDPNDPQSLLEKGLALVREERLSEGKSFLERARASMPESALIHFRLGEIYQYVQDVGRAEESYRKALELDPKLAEAQLQLGLLYAHAGHKEQAVSALVRALELDPNQASAHAQLARLEEGLGRAGEATRHFERAIALRPYSAEFHLAFGNFLMRRGDRKRGQEMLQRFRRLRASEDALRELRARIAFEPTDGAAKTALIDQLIEEDRLDEALSEAERFLTLASMEPLHYVLLARAHEARGELEEAVSSLEEAVALFPERGELRDELGRLRSAKDSLR